MHDVNPISPCVQLLSKFQSSSTNKTMRTSSSVVEVDVGDGL